MQKNDHSSEHTHQYGIYILVWLALLTFTGITVAVAGINLHGATVITAITIATIKAYLVLTIFMHLRTESKTFKIFVAVAMFFLVISLVLLFSDYSFH